MHQDQNYDETLLDIQILAVQIEESNKHKAQKRARLYYDQLNKMKQSDYQCFKASIQKEIKEWGFLPALFITVGILSTKRFLMGSLAGIGVAYGVKKHFSWVASSIVTKG